MATIKRAKLTRGDLALYDGENATYDRVDATGGTITGLRIGNTVDVLQLFGGGTARTVATVNAATARLGSRNVTLSFAPGTWTIDDDLTIPANFSCRIPAGCLFNISSSKTLTFSGPVIADDSTINSGAGTLTLSVDSLVNGQVWYKRTASEISASVTPSDYSYPEGNVLRYGATGDGSTDDTSAVQDAFDSNKGKTVFFPQGYTFLCGNDTSPISLNDSTYDDTTIIIDGKIKLGARSTSSTWNISDGSANSWACFYLKDCNNVVFKRGRFDGNRSNQPDNEQTHVIVVAGCSGIKIHNIVCEETRGDFVYVTQSLLASSSTNSSDLVIDNLYCSNSADDGRNAISIISCDRAAINNVVSYQVGGTINSVVMPGGFDIEPNATYQSCTNITVSNVTVTTAGTSGFAIQGRAGTTVTRNVAASNITVTNTAAASIVSADDPGTNSQTNNQTLLISNANNVRVTNHVGRHTGAYGHGMVITGSDYVYVESDVSHVRVGCEIGNQAQDSSGNGVRYSDIKVNVNDISRWGFQTGKITQTSVSGRVRSIASGYYTSSLFGVQAILYTQTDCVYSVDVVAESGWVRSYRADVGNPPTFTRTYIKDCDLQGTWTAEINQNGDMQVPRYNVRGVTDKASIPTAGNWVQGTFVSNTGASLDGNNMTLSGWVRLTSSNANVSGTDWALAYVSHVTPAT